MGNLKEKRANEKHLKYNRAAEDIGSAFTPMVCTTDCIRHSEFKKVLSKIAYGRRITVQ